MKRFITIVSLLAISTLTSPVFAQDSTNSDLPVRDVMRQNIVERKEEVMEKRTELRERIQTVRDERKLQALERIENMLNRINERRTDHFLRVLERLRRILGRIQARSDRAKAAGKDVSAVEAAIAQATAAIDTAEQAVQAQKVKVYEVSVTDETTARSEVAELLRQLHEDLRAVGEQVRTARQAVFDALRQLVAVVGEPEP
jgi:vacuolar-type H+-ATPase subunit I/STV1